jgi:methylglutaconyl-CoA hydratase
LLFRVKICIISAHGSISLMTRMTYTHIIYNIENHIATISLSRPEKRNALNDLLIQELTDVFTQSNKNSSIKVVTLTGSNTVFCSGADLDYLQKLSLFSLAENQEDSRKLMKLFQTIYEMRKPIVAIVNGPAIAGGCGLATVCDFILASKEHARFGYSEVRIGFVPALVLVFLIRRIGEGRARELVLSGTTIDAMRAYEMGLVTEVVEHNKLSTRAIEFAQRLVEDNSSNSMSLTKEMIATLHNMDFMQALEYAANMNAVARMTEDCKKGIAAFLNKEKIHW